MFTGLPFSMEHIPKQKGFGCLSLKFGCILSGLTLILYSVLVIAHSSAAIATASQSLKFDWEGVLTYGVLATVILTHCVTLFLTAIMLVGTLREKPHLMRPWLVWMSVQIMIYVLMFVFWTTTNMVSHMGDTSMLGYALEFLTLLIRFYMLVLVASYYDLLEKDREYGERLKSLNNQHWYNSA
uniref:Uncharacterized protein n=1 Tax=Bombyx mori TaxID=7091 RepID=A0A8R2R159_BOMMO|nr:uncharacterized protein LOC101745240 isoform X2 [Bombyx mori]